MDSKAYPQFNAAKSSALGNLVSSKISFPEDFMHDSTVHHRPGQITSLKMVTPQHAIITTKAIARRAVMRWTHETLLSLYDTADALIDSLYLHLFIWNERVFRVIFSSHEAITDPFLGLPEDRRMLIGKMQQTDVKTEEKENEWVFRTDWMTIRISKSNACITAEKMDGTLFFAEKRSEFNAADIFDRSVSIVNDQKSCFEAIELDQDELIYGLGERFDSLVRNGRAVDFHNKDAVGTTSRRTYVNIPFYLSTKSYGLFLNSSAPTDWQIATNDQAALGMAVQEDQMDYFVMSGDSPSEILHEYCCLTGFSKLPPLWSFGLWMSRNSYTSWDVTEEIARQVRKNDIPCDVLHLDTAWFNRDWNCDLRFSPERFPHPEEHFAALKQQGFHVSLWQYNFIPPNDDNQNYHEAVANGYLAKDEQGNPYQLPEHCIGSWVDDVIIDFTNPDACVWYQDQIRNLMRMGAGAIKTDFGEGIPEDAYYANLDGKHIHNLYSLVYNATVFEACRDVTGENIVWARSGTAGSQRYPIHWGGDSQCTFEALACTLRAALSIGISGIPFFSHDIGGFIGMPDDELYVRWAQMGLFSSHSRCHGAGDYTHREPWFFSEEACEIFRRYDKLRYSLMPYIYEEAAKCVETGLPMMRALYLIYPQDRNTRTIDDEYLFGDFLLIAPVLKPLCKSCIREVYLPAGTWYDYWTHEKICSFGQWIKRKVDLATMPIYVKQGAVINYCGESQTLMNGMGPIVRTEHWIE